MTVLKERDGQALVKYEEHLQEARKNGVRFEWWFDTQKMREGIKLEEKNGKTNIYCYEFRGSYREYWLKEEFDRRVPKDGVVLRNNL